MIKVRSLLVLSLVSFTVPFSSEVRAIDITFGKPLFPVPTLEVPNPLAKVSYQVFCPRNGEPGRNVNVMINVNKNFTAQGKANEFITQLGDRCTNNPVVPNVRDGAKVSMPYVTKVEKLQGDITGQEDIGLSIAKLEIPKQAKIGFDGVLVGLDPDGNESIFEASLGFDGIVANSSLSFGELTTPDIDGLLTGTFNELLSNLPLLFKNNLSLDLNSDLITFIFPDGTSSGFVSSSSTDSGVSSTFSLEVTQVPEPTLTLSLLALGTLGAASTLKRKLKPSKTSEKETTKVS